MKLADLQEVENQKVLLDRVSSLLKGLQKAESPFINIAYGSRPHGQLTSSINYNIEDDAFRTMLIDALSRFAEVVKQRLTHLGVEL